MSRPSNEDPRREIIEWNIKYPLDRWWRKKHNIAFRSKKHLEANQYDIWLEFYEDMIFSREPEKPFQYIPGTGLPFKTSIKNTKMSQSDLKKLDEIVDISDIKYDSDGNIIL